MMGRPRSAIATALLLLAGCGPQTGPGPGSGRSHDAEREWQLAGDENATPDQIIDGGRPARVAASGGQTLITWVVTPEDDEGPAQGAWRLYDVAGRHVAEGKLGIVHEAGAVADVTAVDDGFLLGNYTAPALIHVSPTGALTPVSIADRSRPTQPGDVVVRECCDAVVYRPSDRTAFQLPRMPDDQWQSVALDGAGKVWVMLPWGKRGDARVAWAQGGVEPWTTEVVDLPTGSSPTMGMALAGGQLMFPQARSSMTEFVEFQAIWRRTVGAGGGRWRSVPFDPALLPRSIDLQLSITAGGRLLVRGDEATALEQPDGSFALVDTPGDDAEVTPVGDRLYANVWHQAELYVSTDLGRTWTIVDR